MLKNFSSLLTISAGNVPERNPPAKTAEELGSLLSKEMFSLNAN